MAIGEFTKLKPTVSPFCFKCADENIEQQFRDVYAGGVKAPSGDILRKFIGSSPSVSFVPVGSSDIDGRRVARLDVIVEQT